MKAGLQAALSACLILVAFLNLDLGQVSRLALRPQCIPMLGAALVAFNASKILGAVRLNMYQRHAAMRLSEGDNLRLYYAGMFLNMFLPGGIGGDAYKVLVLHRSFSLPLRTLLAITLADRAGGMLILVLMLCMLVLMLPLPWDASAVVMLSSSAFVATLAVFVLVHRSLVRLDTRRLAGVFALGVGVQCLQLLCMGMLLAYLGAPGGSYTAYLALFLVSSIAAVLPLSIGGLGVREATFLVGVRMVGLEPAYGVLASTCFFLLTLLSSMIGSLYLGHRPHRAAAGK